MTRNQDGSWSQTIVHDFNRSSADGDEPYGQLVFDAVGNLYGTTYYGGAYGEGVVYQLSPATVGWKQTILHTFVSDSNDGANPQGGVILDSAGNVYGTTFVGGSNSQGTIFELSPTLAGGWKETILHNFGGHDGAYPFTALTLGPNGSLYGTTVAGGPTEDAGVVFELSPKVGGGWTYKLVHAFSFNTTDGCDPAAPVTFDTAGNLYGTTSGCGSHIKGMAFKLIPGSTGKWLEVSVHDFGEDSSDGQFPYFGLVFDAAGNLYGMTPYGGVYQGGTVFKLTPDGRENWTETILHAFDNNGIDGWGPSGTVVLDPAGNLYGTADQGGTYNDGIVFEVTP
jgi:uncharacterized repeat protein (TIGR03803 family)